MKAIDKAHAEFLAAMKAGDATRLVELLTDDVEFCPPNEHARKGKQEVKAWAQQAFSQVKTWRLSVSDRQVVPAGDWAFESGSFVSAIAPATDGALTEVKGRFLTVWQRQADGKWKIAHDIWNSSQPLPSVNLHRPIGTKEPVTL